MVRSVLLASVVTTAAVLAACTTGPGERWVATARVAGVVVDEMDFDISSIGYSASGEVDYSSLDIGIGATRMRSQGEGAPEKKIDTAEITIGIAEFDTVDAIEFGGGGRWYFAQGDSFSPYASLYAVSTVIEEIGGVDPGVQLGARLGAGVQIDLGDTMFFDAGIDYTIPIVAAESDTGNVDTEFDGFAVRIGFGVYF